MLAQDIPLVETKEELARVPYPSPIHRHAAPFSPWPWIDFKDGRFLTLENTRVLVIIIMLIRLTGFDPMRLTVAPCVPEFCDHNPAKCNRCWKGYPQSLFPNWTERQIRKAKIYNAVHNYPTNKPCICYRVDVNDQGFFTHTEEVTAGHGDEDRTWDNMIHEQVSFIHSFDT